MENTEALEENTTVEVPITIEKVKKPRSEKQIAAFAIALEKRDAKRKERMDVKSTVVIKKKKVADERIVKKAILLKKKEMRDALLDQLEDDKEIDDDIKNLRMKIEKKKITPAVTIQKPNIIFR